MSLVRDALRSRRAKILIGFAVALVAWQVALTLLAPTKIEGQFKPSPAGRVNVLVTLRVTPERFHVLVFQQHGRVSGTQDESIEVRGVRYSDLAAVARPYWVKRVEPLRDD
ncbi:MAG TPA: hypothetical protein VM491_15905 [Burkholderiaceae bacterium]|nr:hypothetical protein [Burkholderiaceae bacterium]